MLDAVNEDIFALGRDLKLMDRFPFAAFDTNAVVHVRFGSIHF